MGHRNMIFNLLTIIYLIGYVNAEMCLLNPYQRGGLVPDEQLNAVSCYIQSIFLYFK